ncbi:sterol desaturase/sphingolipid hydroxylase (fatty acid hydroxylase superfamily) [Litorimonas taeanensis]|uniref:Sterol desaturase/sphingolipid hydroxylase (Fatty acid hydroxylase superfamily) n=1 Tax=Litorimonas taeanensis TaxID=568099 RepID=A0A420WI68_9PROT|nr:sterol desaturase family protein [Litorimonas taeanensis]RKQ70724.1 sterol desaturase/sphingolipid hydroxylase (fatty acid hydroxylase superfamily) [Litorimonas taeanensis]
MNGWPIPIEQSVITYLAFTAIIIARYFAIVWPIHWALWKKTPKRARRLSKREPTAATIRNEITLSVLSAFIYALPAAIVVEMWKAGGTALYSGWPQSVWGWLYLPFSIMVYLIVQDSWFYFTHRLMHHRRLFKWTHAGHHRSVQPTPWASFSFDPIEAVSSAWLLPVMALFVPLHIAMALFLLMLMTINAVFNHAGWEVYPERWIRGWWGRHIITASHHNLHHTKFKGNYGLYFRFWDKLCETDIGVD